MTLRSMRGAFLLSSAATALFSGAASAQDVCTTSGVTTITTAQSPAFCNLGPGESLTVTDTGSLTSSGDTVELGIGAGDVNNAGSLNAPSGFAFALGPGTASTRITNSGAVSGSLAFGSLAGGTIGGGINNLAGGSLIGTGGPAIGLGNGTTLQNGIANAGQITGNVSGIALSSSSIAGGITNSGTIEGQTDDALSFVSSAITDGITNQAGGTITAVNGDDAISFSNTTLTGNISNSGDIIANDDALFLDNSGTVITGDIVNTATGSITTTSGDGMLISDTASVTGSITNAGTINAGDDGMHLISGVAIGGAISNTGTIMAGNDGIEVSETSVVTGGISNSGLISVADSGIEISTSSNIGAPITNSGTITATGDGIRLEDMGTVAPSIANTGTITAGAQGIEIAGTASVTGQITNSGTITSTGSSGIFVTSSGVGGITNQAGGTIAGSTFAIEVISETAPFTVTNSGVLDGNVQLSDSDLVLNGAVSRVIGNIQGFGTDVTVNGTFASEGTMNVATVVVSGGAALTLGGNVTATSVTNSGTLAISDGDARTITGDYTQGAGGLLRVGGSSGLSYGTLNVTGTADLTASNTIAVNVSASETFLDGETLSDVVTAGTLSAGSLTVTDNSARLSFAGVVDGNTIDLSVSASAVADMTENPVALAVGEAIDEIAGGTPSMDTQAVIDAVNSLSTDDAVEDALIQLAPSLTGSHAQVNVGVAQSGATSVVLDRMIRLGMPSGGSDNFTVAGRAFFAPDTAHADVNGWLRPFAERLEQNDVGGVPGFTVSGAGLAFGADALVGDDWRAGIALSFGSYDNDGASSTINSSVTQFTAYGTYMADANTNVHLLLGLGYSSNSSDRSVDFGGLDMVAQGDYASRYAILAAEWEQRIDIGPDLQIIPNFGASYVVASADGYTETGAPGANLTVDASDSQQTTISAGARLVRALSDTQSISGHLGLDYALLEDVDPVTSTLIDGGASFSTTGVEASRLGLTAGVGYDVLSQDGLDISMRYDVGLRDNFTSHAVSLNIRMEL